MTTPSPVRQAVAAERVYQDDACELWFADSLDSEQVAAVMGGRRADALILDAPYSERTHSGHDGGVMSANRAAGFARETTGKSDSAERRYAARVAAGKVSPRRKIDYQSWSPENVARFCDAWCPLTDGWHISITDDVLAAHWGAAFEANGLYRFAPLPLVETGSRVRLTGDGPSNWTCWIVVARPRGKTFSTWGTLPGAYLQPSEREMNSLGGTDRIVGGKPLQSMCGIVRDYSKRGALVVDPTCGAATTGLAAKQLGRRFIGIDTSKDRLAIAVRRLSVAREQRDLFEAEAS